MMQLTGLIIIVLSVSILYFSLKIYLLWHALPREKITSILLWLAFGLSFIGIGGICEGFVAFANLPIRYMAVGGMALLVGMFVFTVGILKTRGSIYEFLNLN